MKIKNVSVGFVTNSSTYVTTIVVNKEELRKKLNKLTNKEINKIVEEKFKDFLVKDLHINEDDIWKDFIKRVKLSIHKVINELKEFAEENKGNNKPYLVIRSNCSIDGSTINKDKPEAYALWFILKYILLNIALDTDTCYC